MIEVLSYLHSLKTTSMFYMYEAATINKILEQVLRLKMHKSINTTMSFYFLYPPDMKVTIYYTTHHVLGGTKKMLSTL